MGRVLEEQSKRKIVGIILTIDTDLVGNYPYDKFLEKATCSLSNIDIPPSNYLTCKYYDDATGEIYFHFDYPVKREILEVAFSEDELIYEIEDYNN